MALRGIQGPAAGARGSRGVQFASEPAGVLEGSLRSTLAVLERGLRSSQGRMVLERGVLERGVLERGVLERIVLERGVLERGVLERTVLERGVLERDVQLDQHVLLERPVLERGVLERGGDLQLRAPAFPWPGAGAVAVR